jgi:AraC family transcriptional regulator of adaptative response/methylated-DNA-[protein]-cysteine methyltransferase
VYEAGYGSPSRLYETAAGALGMAPREYRQGGRAQHIQYGVARCALGWVLVATTARGLCRVAIADSVHELETELGGEYPQARLSRDDRALKTVLAAVVELAEGRPGAALPTDLKGTVFQQQVWKALQQIPAGTTRTYAEVAASICRPSSARAVARACAANPLALVVPCHRVVPSAGGVGGYRWGKSRKSRLLAAEAKP